MSYYKKTKDKMKSTAQMILGAYLFLLILAPIAIGRGDWIKMQGYDGAEWESVAVDAATNSLNVIDYEHHEIHSGSHFYVSGFETVANGGYVNFSFTTPDTTEWIHMTFIISGTSQTELIIYEGAAVSGGASTTPFNNDRNSAHASVATISKNPTVNTVGTIIYSESKGLVGATPRETGTAGLISRDREIILKQDTTYVFSIVSRDDDNIVSYVGEWYEHTNK